MRGLLIALTVLLLAPAAAAAQVPDDEIGVTAMFTRNYLNQFPGPEIGEPEIGHADMTFDGLVGLRVTVSHARNVVLNDPGIADPWHVTVVRSGQVVGDAMTSRNEAFTPQQEVDIPLYPQAGDVVQVVGPTGYAPRTVTFDGLPVLDTCAPGSGVVTAHTAPGAPGPSMLPDRLFHGRTELPVSGSGAVTIPVPAGPATSVKLDTSREVAPGVTLYSYVKADPPFCGGPGPRDGWIDGGELYVGRRGVRFLDPIRCSPYGAVACRVEIRATARRKGKRVTAAAGTLTIAPGSTTGNRVVPFKRWVRRALRSRRIKDPRVSAAALVHRPAPIPVYRRARCTKRPADPTC